jgi:K+ transporter
MLSLVGWFGVAVQMLEYCGQGQFVLCVPEQGSN